MMGFSRNDILDAIKNIDESPAIRNKRSSSTYDLIFDGKIYPPILVLSVASQLKGGKELFLADFEDKVERPFKILRNLGFEIKSKKINLKSEYNSWAVKNLHVEETTKKQYVTNLENLSEIIGYKIFETNDIKIIQSLYSDLLKEQKIIGGKYYRENRPSASLKGWYSAAAKTYLDFLKSFTHAQPVQIPENNSSFNHHEFIKVLDFSMLKFHPQLVKRFIASLLTKPFVILTGLSGSGKTKIAQSFVQWICESEKQYKIVPVGADWTNREPLLGYPNGLESKEYITPDSGVIHLFLEALKEKNKDKPYFLILDEMNLSHVERYFADFLSIMESEDTIKLYTGIKRQSLDEEVIPKEIGWPTNLFIIGTVNIDETTYMFSPKVLDRANVIEFRVTADDIGTFISNPTKPDLKLLEAKGAAMAADFLRLAGDKSSANTETATLDLLAFFNQLKKVGAEFGYRSASEIMILINQLKRLNPAISDYECLDIAIMQKLLPKLHGSRSKLAPVLKTLAALCVDVISTNEFEKTFDDLNKIDFADISVKYEISFEKIVRMYRNVLANGFTSYAEA